MDERVEYFFSLLDLNMVSGLSPMHAFADALEHYHDVFYGNDNIPETGEIEPGPEKPGKSYLGDDWTYDPETRIHSKRISAEVVIRTL